MKKVHFLAIALVALTCLSSALSTRAEAPAGVVRTFGFAVQPGSALPDYLGENSIALTVLPPPVNTPNNLLEFGSVTDPDDFYDNSVWHANPAHHSTNDGSKDVGTRFWFVTEETPTPPPIGSHTFTGMGSPFILSQQVVYIATCNAVGGCPVGEDSKYRFTSSSSGVPFVVVTAVFSK